MSSRSYLLDAPCHQNSMQIPEREIRGTLGEPELRAIQTFESELGFRCGMLGLACRAVIKRAAS